MTDASTTPLDGTTPPTSTTPPRSIEFGVLLHGSGGHLSGWRVPGSPSDGQLDIDFHVRLARTLEAAGVDAVFIADVVAIWGKDLDSLSRTARADFFEPLTLLSALSTVTERIGLVATATTSYNEPYSIARKFASLDHLSAGRAGWNVVTSVVPLEAANFGRDEHYDHADRYRHAEEFVDVVTGLWDGYDDDAVIRDQDAGVYYREDGQHELDHHGEFFDVRGPLNISRSPQGHPVLFQAGASETGQRFAAAHGEVIFTAPGDLDRAVELRSTLRRLAEEAGRRADDLRVWAVLTPLVGESGQDARDKFDALQALISDDTIRRSIQDNIGDLDLTGVDLDGPFPDIPDSNRSKSRQQGMLDVARAENLTIRGLASRLAERGTTFGTAVQIADHIEQWFRAGAVDGFNISFPYLPQTLDDFVDRVLPILRERGVFWEHYGDTLRDTLGLARPGTPVHTPAALPEGASR